MSVREAVAGFPTILDRCESIRLDTRGPLERAFAKLLVEPRPPWLPERVGEDRIERALERFDRHQAALEAVVADVASDLRSDDYDPTSVRRSLDRASAKVSALRSTLDRLDGYLGTPRSAADADRRGGRTAETTWAETLSSEDGETETATLAGAEGARAARRRISADPLLDPGTRLAALADDLIRGTDVSGRSDPVAEIMAYPEFERPMYQPLADLDQRYLLPGVADVPPNSVGAVATNPTFIESYLVGLNHEFSRELRWRQFPTDRRGSYFRHFWDRRGTDGGGDSGPPDVEELHRWGTSPLGTNSPGETSLSNVVLLVRGELLRRYPNTIIYAAKAVEDSGDRVPALKGTPVTRADAELDDISFPVFRGKLEPDITFFGFEITPEQAVYGPYHRPGKDPPSDPKDEGWFFVLEEPPGESKFGLDVNQGDVGEQPYGVALGDGSQRSGYSSGDEFGWSALSWGHLVPYSEYDGAADPQSLVEQGAYLSVADSQPMGNDGLGSDPWRIEAGDPCPAGWRSDWGPEDAAEWGKNGADMARITLQQPVQVAIHADDMLPPVPVPDTYDVPDDPGDFPRQNEEDEIA